MAGPLSTEEPRFWTFEGRHKEFFTLEILQSRVTRFWMVILKGVTTREVAFPDFFDAEIAFDAIVDELKEEYGARRVIEEGPVGTYSLVHMWEDGGYTLALHQRSAVHGKEFRVTRMDPRRDPREYWFQDRQRADEFFASCQRLAEKKLARAAGEASIAANQQNPNFGMF